MEELVEIRPLDDHDIDFFVHISSRYNELWMYCLAVCAVFVNRT